MEHTFKEIATILQHGHIAGKETIFLEVFDIILSCTGQEDAKQHFTEEFLMVILKFSGHTQFNKVLYRILINIFSEENLNEKLSESKAILSSVLNFSLCDIFDRSSEYADSGCMLLSNITRSQTSSQQVLKYLLGDNIRKMISVFTTIQYNPTCDLDQLAMVLCNLSQLAEVRNIITQTDECMMQKLVPFINHENAIRRRGISGVVHNCAFDSSLHKWMLSDEVDLLPCLLLPLAGPEQFDDEDNDKLPIELQYLPETKTREPNPEIRKQILETLNQLCATTFGRQFLRDHNAYIILRELHKWEEDPSALLACENVVDILIRTEEEIGIDHLKIIEIPPDIEEKFNKVLTTS